MKSGLQYLQHLSKEVHSKALEEEEYKPDHATDPSTIHNNTIAAPAAADSTNANIHLPYINSTCMSPYMFLDRYYDKIRNDWLYFDKESCCSSSGGDDDDDLLPQQDETVFVSTVPRYFRGAYSFGHLF